MDNLLFESQTTYTKNIVKKSFKAWFSNKKLWLIFLLPTVIIAFGFVEFFQDKSYALLIIGFGSGILLTTIILIRYHLNLKINYARALEQNNGQEVNFILQFFDSGILIKNTLTENKINYTYTSIKKILKNKTLIILVTKTNILLAIEKARFTVGNPSELISFLKSKISKN